MKAPLLSEKTYFSRFNLFICFIFTKPFINSFPYFRSAAIFIVKLLRLLKYDLRLMLHDAELADAVIDMDHCITQRICRKMPLIIVPAVALIDHPYDWSG